MSEREDSSATEASGARRRVVLVAEDDESVRSMLGVALRAVEFEPVLCIDGQDAIEQLEAGLQVDLLLMDIRMPRLSGIDLVKRIRRQQQFASLPVVAMSAYSDKLQEDEIRAAGANAFLPKPFTIADLRTILGSLVTR